MKKKLQYLRQLLDVRYCGIFYQEITSDLKAKQIIIIIITIIIIIIITIIAINLTSELKSFPWLI